jgi:hypothetical protein
VVHQRSAADGPSARPSHRNRARDLSRHRSGLDDEGSDRRRCGS